MTVDGDLAGPTSTEEEDEVTEKDDEDTFETGSFYTKVSVSRFQNAPFLWIEYTHPSPF